MENPKAGVEPNVSRTCMPKSALLLVDEANFEFNFCIIDFRCFPIYVLNIKTAIVETTFGFPKIGSDNSRFLFILKAARCLIITRVEIDCSKLEPKLQRGFVRKYLSFKWI